MRSNPIPPFIIMKAKRNIGLPRIKPFFLKRISPYLVYKSYTAAFLPQIYQYTHLHPADGPQGGDELIMAVTPERTKHIACHTLGMQSHNHVFLIHNIPMNKGAVLLIIPVIIKCRHLKLPISRWKISYGLYPYTYFITPDSTALMVFIFIEEVFNIFTCQSGR